ncbi:Choline dehydrogenase [Colletotrichum siamense]|uniref:Choline dehydrogenase n=1 Tax=Colletotrichum siamense TaxID=690259 RepID=A0A9P5K2G8_COLSI|nr:Choline dehydrogenase [Colletotrichum siamense]
MFSRRLILGVGTLLSITTNLVVARKLAENSTYDYIVIGSGPGGGPLASNLARAGFSTLLLEAGDDESHDIGTALANGGYALTTSNSWGFWVKHHADPEVELRHNHLTWRFPNGTFWVGNGERAPPGAELMGVHENMRRVFEKVEKNNYLPEGTPGHGFGGILETNMGNGTQYLPFPGLVEVYKAQIRSLGLDPEKVIEMLGSDPNYLANDRDLTEGFWGMVFHANARWERSTPRDYIFETIAAENEDGSAKYPLTLSSTSLATKVLFEEGKDEKPRAVGVEYLKGPSTYGADPRRNASVPGETKRAFASREVIVSGGTFNSPQLLQLSGIGDRQDLEALGIKVVADLPGVGRNLQDNQEFPVVGLAQINFTAIPNPNEPTCEKGMPNDPCYELWKKGLGPYMRPGFNSNVLLMRSNHSVNGERDIFVFSVQGGAFRGFWPDVNQPELFGTPNTSGFSTVKINPQNGAGYLKLRSADPTEPPEINFQLYQEGAETDLGALADVAAWGRRVMSDVGGPWGPLAPAEPPCSKVGSDGQCEDGDGTSDEEWIRAQTFGHHPSGTCAIGPAEDSMAVLDSRFRVHGVEGLRVVDASVFPRAPGAFPLIATFMVSQKASEVILEDAAASF